MYDTAQPRQQRGTPGTPLFGTNRSRSRKQHDHQNRGSTDTRRKAAPSANHNSRRRDDERPSHPLSSLWKQQLFLVAISLTGLSLWYLTPLSEIVIDVLLQEIPIEADVQLGEEALRDFPFPTVHHSQYTPLLQQVGWELVSSSSSSSLSSSSSRLSPNDYQWDFGVVDTSGSHEHRNMINAFALPGGAIRVTKALLDTLQLTKGEVAALLGHEMGHVLHRHSQARMLERSVLYTVAQALIYDDKDDHRETFGEAMGELLLQSADWLGQQSFSRRNEYQADATSWDLLMATATTTTASSSSSTANNRPYHPQALRSLLHKLYQASGGRGGTTSWESTHPGTLDRIQALDQTWENLPVSERRRLERASIR